jgi:hypothetical protein
LRRLVSIFFLVVFLFNVGGYYLVFWGMEIQAHKNLITRLDANDYRQDDLVVLSIPLSMPYPIHSGEYERIDGEFIHEGSFYKLVKQKLENDTLFIVCIKDKDATRLATVKADYSKVASNVPTQSKSALTYIAKLYKDFNTTEFKIFYKSRFLYDRTYYALAAPSIREAFSGIEAPPPEDEFRS